MRRIFAYECYADGALFQFLSNTGKAPIRGLHAFGQGEVVNALLLRKKAEFGMVDEDPRSTHHPLRDAMTVVLETEDFELREREGRYLAILKPELEVCFLRAARLLGIEITLPREASHLHRMLNRPNASAQSAFVESLELLYAQARSSRRSIFLTELVAMLEKVPTK